MKTKSTLFLLFLAVGSASRTQEEAHKKALPPECTNTTRVQGAFLKGPFKILPKENYKRHPFLGYQIKEEGVVSNVVPVHEFGVSAIGKKVIDVVRRWKYKARTASCGPIKTELSVRIDWAAAPMIRMGRIGV